MAEKSCQVVGCKRAGGYAEVRVPVSTYVVKKGEPPPEEPKRRSTVTFAICEEHAEELRGAGTRRTLDALGVLGDKRDEMLRRGRDDG